MDCLKLYAGDYMHFAAASFPEFSALSIDDQRIMLKNFASRLYTVETHCGTFRKFGSHDGPYYMGTLTTCHDARKFQFFTEEEDPASNEEIVKLMNYYTDRTKRMLGPILTKSKFTDIEYAVLFGLSVWQIDPNQSMPDHIVTLSDSVRRKIFESMKGYYQDELKIEDYSVRLGNLITFEHTIQEKELEDYTEQFRIIRNEIERNTLERYPDAYLLWDKKVETERICQINHDISRYISRHDTIIEEVVTLQKSLPKLREKKIFNDFRLRSAACHSIEKLLTHLPIITNSVPVFQSQSHLLTHYSEAEEVLESLKESTSAKKRMSSLQLLYRKAVVIDDTLKTIDNLLDDQIIPYDARNFTALSLIVVNRSARLLCSILKSLVKRVEMCDSEVRAISNVFWFLYSAMSIMNTIPVDQEYTTVEGAFQCLGGIATGKKSAEESQAVETPETFNRLNDRLVTLLAETIKTSKNQERSGK